MNCQRTKNSLIFKKDQFCLIRIYQDLERFQTVWNLRKQSITQKAYYILRINNMWFMVMVMVGPAGLEPATPALSTRCSNQLSYGPD
jgi:hypothetical protein